MASYSPDLQEESASGNVELPSFLVCSVVDTPEGKKTLALPASFRSKWADDSIRREKWEQELARFDSRSGFRI